MLALDLHVVISDLHTELIRREVLDVQVDCELIPVRPHLGDIERVRCIMTFAKYRSFKSSILSKFKFLNF